MTHPEMKVKITLDHNELMLLRTAVSLRIEALRENDEPTVLWDKLDEKIVAALIHIATRLSQ